MRRLVYGFGLLVLAGFAFHVWLLPVLAERLVVDLLADLGLGAPEAKVVAADFTALHLHDVAIGPSLRAQRVDVSYGPVDLLKGRVRHIVLHGVTWDSARTPARAARATQASEGEAFAIPDLPFDSLAVRNGTVLAGGRRFDVVATIERKGSDGLELDARVRADRVIEGVALHDARIVLHLATVDGLVRVAPGSELSLASAEAVGARVGGVTVAVEEGPLFRDGVLSLAVASSDVTADGPGFTVVVDGVTGHAALRLSPLHAEGEIAVRGTVAAGDLRLDGVVVEFPFGGEQEGRVAVAAVHVGARDLPGFEGTAAWSQGELRVAADWPVAGSIHLAAQVGRAGSVFEASRETGPLVPPDPLMHLLEGAGVRAEGALGFHVRVPLGGKPGLRLDLEDVTLRHAGLEAEASGLRGTVTADGLAPLSTPPGQRLDVKHLKLGALELTDGSVSFRATGDGAWFVERTAWTWGDGGRLHVHAVRITPEATQFDLELFVENIPLDAWLDLAANGRVRGDGRLFGRVPVLVRPGASPAVTLGAGFLYAEPGGGRLSVLDAETTRDLVARAGEGLGDVRERLVDALEDFDFSYLTFDLVEREGRLDLRIETRGKGHGRSDSIEIGSFVVNVRDFGSLVDRALLWSKGWDRAVDGRLERFFNDVSERRGP